eukprot:scaffold4607_cov76-Skeletonema_dohrnii-CCMP3373.AAC.2
MELKVRRQTKLSADRTKADLWNFAEYGELFTGSGDAITFIANQVRIYPLDDFDNVYVRHDMEQIVEGIACRTAKGMNNNNLETGYREVNKAIRQDRHSTAQQGKAEEAEEGTGGGAGGGRGGMKIVIPSKIIDRIAKQLFLFRMISSSH